MKNTDKANAEKAKLKVHSMSDTDFMIVLFRAAHEIDIDRLGRVLKFLGLAEDSPQSVFRWKPTPRLVGIIAERAARPPKASKKRSTKKDRALVDSLVQLAGGWVDEVDDDFLFRVLKALGLLRYSKSDGELKPTALLREVFEDMSNV